MEISIYNGIQSDGSVYAKRDGLWLVRYGSWVKLCDWETVLSAQKKVMNKMAQVTMSHKHPVSEDQWHVRLDCGTCFWITSETDPHFTEVECPNELCVIHNP